MTKAIFFILFFLSCNTVKHSFVRKDVSIIIDGKKVDVKNLSKVIIKTPIETLKDDSSYFHNKRIKSKEESIIIIPKK